MSKSFSASAEQGRFVDEFCCFLKPASNCADCQEIVHLRAYYAMSETSMNKRGEIRLHWKRRGGVSWTIEKNKRTVGLRTDPK